MALAGASHFLANGLALILTFSPKEKEQPSPASYLAETHPTDPEITKFQKT
jgi:hypothetical protein